MIGLGLSIPQVAVRGGGGGFSPESLFANGEAGAWYDPSDLSTLWQDAAGTIPVTADGDPVGRVGDKSGNGHHLTQSTTAAKPAYRTDGMLHWLAFDGVDDFLSVVNAIKTTVSDWSFFIGARITAASDGPFFFDSQTGRLAFGSPGDAGESTGYFDGSWKTTSATFGVDHVNSYLLSGGGVVRVDGSQALSDTYTQKAISGTTRVGGEYNAPRHFITGRIYGIVLVDRAVTVAERDGNEAFLANKAGITL